MPTKNHNRRITQKARKGIDKRAGIKRTIRQASKREIKTSAASIADTIHSISFKPLNLLQVASKMEKSVIEGNDYNRVYKDILEAYKHAMKLTGKSVGKFDPFRNNGMELHAAIQEVTRRFKNEFVPDGFDLEIEMEPDQIALPEERWYYYCINKAISSPCEWLSFEIKSIVNFLDKRSQKLHDLYVEVIGQLYNVIGINTWEGGKFSSDWMLDSVHEQIYQDGEDSDYSMDDYNNMVQLYRKGDAKRYHKLISSAGLMTTDEMQSILLQTRGSKPIRNFLKHAIELLRQPQRLSMYTYQPSYYIDYREDCLWIEDQVTIIWDYDLVTRVMEEFLDAQVSNFGVNDFILAVPVSKYSKTIQIGLLTQESISWPEKLRNLQIEHQHIVNHLKKQNGKH